MANVSTPAARYLAEVFVAGSSPDALDEDSERIHAAARALTDAGEPVRHLFSLLIPGEETAFHVFEADRPESVEHALHAVGLDPERVSLVISARRPRADVPAPNGAARGDEGDA